MVPGRDCASRRPHGRVAVLAPPRRRRHRRLLGPAAQPVPRGRRRVPDRRGLHGLGVRHAGRTVMFPGDVEQPGWDAMATACDDISAEVLVASHHGRKSGYPDNGVMPLLDPSAVVISSDKLPARARRDRRVPQRDRRQHLLDQDRGHAPGSDLGRRPARHLPRQRQDGPVQARVVPELAPGPPRAGAAMAPLVRPWRIPSSPPASSGARRSLAQELSDPLRLVMTSVACRVARYGA
jgi:hypothetical protein